MLNISKPKIRVQEHKLQLSKRGGTNASPCTLSRLLLCLGTVTPPPSEGIQHCYALYSDAGTYAGALLWKSERKFTAVIKKWSNLCLVAVNLSGYSFVQ